MWGQFSYFIKKCLRPHGAQDNYITNRIRQELVVDEWSNCEECRLWPQCECQHTETWLLCQEGVVVVVIYARAGLAFTLLT